MRLERRKAPTGLIAALLRKLLYYGTHFSSPASCLIAVLWLLRVGERD